MDVGEDTTLGNGDVAEKLVQFLIVSDGELEMTGNDTGLLVVTGGVSEPTRGFQPRGTRERQRGRLGAADYTVMSEWDG